jgi:hypothetical protein
MCFHYAGNEARINDTRGGEEQDQGQRLTAMIIGGCDEDENMPYSQSHVTDAKR